MYQKIKRILALLGVIVIVLLYAATLILALFGNDQSGELLLTSIVATVVIPVLIYIYLWLYKLFRKNDPEEDPE
jgi:ABC-type transport system involved in cytochrome c biogenesis permease component